FSAPRGLSGDGRCKAFADAADGTGLAEGVGLLLVERLSRARAHGHRVLALVRGSAINQDGASNGLTAPSGPAQRRVITAALADAGLRPADVDAVEATGTRLGDPIEAQALLATYGQDRTEPLWLGSVKSNIGHSQAASGAAGVIKTVQALRHGLLPATLHVDRPTGQVDWSTGAVALLTEPRDWPAVDRPRRAAVSAFGLSGTNAHVILEQAPAEDTERPAPEQPAPEDAPPTASEPALPVVWPVHGRTRDALRAQAARLRTHLDTRPALRPADVGWTLATGRAVFDHRAVVLGTDRDALLRGLDAVAAGTPDPAVTEGAADGTDRVVFVFPGHGAQWPGMARQLLDDSPVFRESVLQCADAFAEFVDWSLLDVLRDAEGAPPLHRVDVVQPALFTMMVSLAALWRSYGVEPSAVVGHSQGEIAAAYVAGALDLRDAARIVATRGKAWLTLAGTGGMASVALPRTEAAERLRPWGDRLDIAAVNDPRSVTVAGDLDALEEFLTGLESEGVRVRRVRQIVGAGHTAHVDALRDQLTETLAPTAPRSAPVAFCSTVTGGLLDTAGLDHHYWYRNARQTVLFEQAVRTLGEQGYGPFLEISAHPMFTVAVQQTLEETGGPATVLATLRRDEGGRERFLRAAAEAHAAGLTVDWRPAFAGTGARTVELPTYAFQRTRHWLEPSGGTGDVTAAGLAPAGHPLLGAVVELADGALVLTGRLSGTARPWPEPQAPSGALVDLLLTAADRADCAGIGDLTVYEPLTGPAGGADTRVPVSAPDAAGTRTAAVHTRTADGPWLRHAEATLTTGPVPGEPLTAWPPADAEPLPVDAGDEHARAAEPAAPATPPAEPEPRAPQPPGSPAPPPPPATRDPRRTMHRAVLGAALGIGLFYVLTTYAMTVYFGPDRFAEFGASGAASWEGVARASFGLFWVLVFLAVVNSTIANANACANVSTRTAFALARIRVLPGLLATLHPRHRSPVAGIAVQTAVAVAAVLGLGLAYGPVTAFLLLATVIVTVVVGVYIIVNLSCAGYFLRSGRAAVKPVRHLLFPVLGSAAFVPALLTAAGLPVFDFVTELTAPVSYAGPVVGAWMAMGAVVLLVLVRRHPERIAETARVHLDAYDPGGGRRSGTVPR
ncbi:type I polyketide synthase, partial [Streptomyces tricolor]